MKSNTLNKLVVAIVTFALLGGAGASAASANSGVTLTSTPALSQAQINAHWSQERMQAADTALPEATPGATISSGRAAVPGKTRVAKAKAKTKKKVRVAPPASIGFSALSVIQQGWLSATAYPNNVGRLYYDTLAGPMVCTGTVVDVNIVLTAAHCVWDVKNRVEHTNFQFVPKKMGTSEPFGRWSRGRAILWNGYSVQGNFSKDYAFIKFQPSGGRNLASTVGYSNILVNASLRSTLYNLGYPAAGVFRQYGGNHIWYCHSPYGGYLTDPSGYMIRMGCQGNGGVSGGPWFHAYNGSWNYIASVNSLCWHSTLDCNGTNGYAEELRGPYFDNSTSQLFGLAQQMQS